MSEEQLIHRPFAALVDEGENQDVFGESGERLDEETQEEGFSDEEWSQDEDEDVDEDEGEDSLEEKDEE